MANDKDNYSGFAEIEYDSNPGHTRTPGGSDRERPRTGAPGESERISGLSVTTVKTEQIRASHAPQVIPVGARQTDPIRKKFEDMRSITAGNPFARNDSGYFYRQAKMMEDFTDNYQGSAEFFMYYPCYHQMSHNQLRTYFTWRTKLRRGSTQTAPLSYAFLYIYELLSGVGAGSPADGLDKLMQIWSMYRDVTHSLDYYIPDWLYDYHIYYELPHSFSDFADQNNLRGYYNEHLLFDSDGINCFESWAGISNYDVGKSKFCADGNEDLMQSCFNAVVREIKERCESQGLSVYDLISRSYTNETAWRPFKRALFSNWLEQPDRQVTMPGERMYKCSDNRWTTNVSLPYAWRKDLAAYLIKKTEMLLRESVKFKHKITADPGVIQKHLRAMKKPRFEFEELDHAIEDAVEGYLREKNRTVVTVDRSNLDRIRAESLGTQEALIVDDGSIRAQGQHAVSAQDLGTRIQDLVETEDVSGQGSGDNWAAFADALSGVEMDALNALLHDGGVKAIADENGIMLEVLADSINEKAMDFIGDSILELEDNMTIFDDYRENVLGALDKSHAID